MGLIYQVSTHPHPINIPYQHTPSTHTPSTYPNNTSYQHTLPTPHVNPSSRPILSTLPINLPSSTHLPIYPYNHQPKRVVWRFVVSAVPPKGPTVPLETTHGNLHKSWRLLSSRVNCPSWPHWPPIIWFVLTCNTTANPPRVLLPR